MVLYWSLLNMSSLRPCWLLTVLLCLFVVANFKWNFLQEEGGGRDLAPIPSVHEQQDGTILGMCITGTASKDSLASWVKFLERTNPCLTKIPVVFRLRTPEAGLQVVQDRDDLQKEMQLQEQQS